DWLAEKPSNYAGEYQGSAIVSPGSWYFDSKDHVLVYRVALGNHFVPEENGRKTIRFRLKLLEGEPAPDKEGDSSREINGLLLVPVDSYRWF
ncbi:MAG TPA: hypothetical protein PLK99_09735, partial [Burkholderiales bacterium]|nr:hypothetical protein [Burkholderiales bacterium]